MRVVPSVDPIHPTDVQIRCEYQYGFTDYSYAPDFTFNMVVIRFVQYRPTGGEIKVRSTYYSTTIDVPTYPRKTVCSFYPAQPLPASTTIT